MNQADNDAGNKAVDSLINYETVKVCQQNVTSILKFSISTMNALKLTDMIIF